LGIAQQRRKLSEVVANRWLAGMPYRVVMRASQEVHVKRHGLG
jgi:hypothetical protein